MDNKTYKMERLNAFDGLMLSESMYNLAIGATLLWGILLNAAMAKYLTYTILSIPYLAVLIIYLVGSIGCMMVVYKSNSPVVSFIGFTGLALAMGLLLTYFLTAFSGQEISKAFVLTGIVTVSMMLISTLRPQFFLSIGRTLGVALIITIVVEILGALIFRSSMAITDYIVVLIFCGYVGYDWAKAQMYPKTLDNAIDSAADIYVDVVNLFIRILSIMSRKRD
ncbi:MAG: US12 family protein [Lachnospiraceae bacterium]|nr:US12 family protein [Lachnospiraceae bacterium]